MTHTTKIIEMCNFFAGLEKDPFACQDVVADAPTMQAKLVEYNSVLGLYLVIKI